MHREHEEHHNQAADAVAEALSLGEALCVVVEAGFASIARCQCVARGLALDSGLTV